MKHICVGKLTIIDSDNGLSHGRHKSHYLNQCWNIQENAFDNVVCEMVSILSRPLCVKDHTGNTADVISVPGKPQRVCNTFSVF